MARGRLAIPLAVAGAVVAAQAAVFLLRPPAADLVEPAPVDAGSYFSAAELARARDFRGPQGWLGLGILGVEAAALVWLVARPPRALLAPRRRPLVAAAAAGAGVSLALTLAPLPLQAVARERAKDVGLVTQGWDGWAADLVRGAAIGAVVAGAGAAAGVGLVRRLPRTWWVPGAAVVVAFGAATTYASPVVLDPLFNDFEELPDGRVRSDVLELAREAGVDVDRVLVMDASRRTTAANAYVTGLGHTKRVVLYDTLLDDFPPDEVRLVVAHELAHVHFRDVPHGLLFVALIALPGMFAVSVLTRRLDRGDAPGPQTVPALALALALVVTPVTWASNQLSRDVEARADSFSLRLTDEPETFIRFERGIARKNVADPDPPAWRSFLFGTHPPTLERIGIGEAYRRDPDPARP
ncbi:M48 family metalloprotease [Conexibacter sp. SYSU D00693]|uniref:M48 family metalloprotease n=1 Tax=Conexibacter sp. SYSU D00693 TaxID=2812560 RepID=UPI00196AF19B|nr:M48 family metalloprotease [Conexibacter sp. SYSU D00693]